MMSIRRFVLMAVLPVFSLIPLACAPGTGGSGGAGGTDSSGSGDNGDGRPNPGLNGYFADDEVWSVITPDLLLLGYGEHAEVALLTSSRGIECVAQDPTSQVSYDNSTLEIKSNFVSADTNQSCSVDLSSNGSACVSDGTGSTTQCALSNASGTARYGTGNVNVTTQGLLRFEACDAVPSDLSREQTWGFFSVHPLLLAFLQDPAEVGGVVAVGGQLGARRFGTVAVSLDENGSPLACIDESAGGTVAWDGQTLDIDLTLEGRGNAAGQGVDGDCSVVFHGTLTYCAIYDAKALNPEATADPGRLVRIDGTGTYTSSVGNGSFKTLYLLASGEDFSSNSGGNGNSGGGFGGGPKR